MLHQRKTPINHFTVIPEYIHGTQGAISKELIKKAFEKTGVYPVKWTVFTKEDFAPSKVSYSIAHVPDDFPDDFCKGIHDCIRIYGDLVCPQLLLRR